MQNDLPISGAWVHRGLRRRSLFFAAASVAAWPARAQPAYPIRPVHLLVPYPAGSGPDQLARLLARPLQDAFGQPFIVENRPGALGVVGTSEVARSRPDGYTLLMTTNTTQAANVALVKDLPYDPVRDFAPVALTVSAPMILLVRPDTPATDVKSYMAYLKTQPDGLAGAYGSAASQVSLAKLQRLSGVDLVAVPYSGIPPAVNDLMGGHVALTFADLAVALPLVHSGKLRALGVTADAPLSTEPTIPALGQAYPGFEVTGWLGVVAPARTPDAVVAQLSAALQKILAEPDMQQRLIGMNYQVQPLGPAPFGEFIKAQIVKWSKDAQEAGIQPQ